MQAPVCAGINQAGASITFVNRAHLQFSWPVHF